MLPTIKLSKLSAIALSKSIKITPNSAREILAQALEHETWDRYVSIANVRETESLDEHLSPDIANHRTGVFAENLSAILGIRTSIAEQLAKSISPFTGAKPKAYRVDIEQYEDEDSINMQDLFELSGGDDGILDVLHRMADNNPELESLKDITDIGDFQNSMRISHPMNPGAHYDALANLTNWELEDAYYEEDYTYLEASFHLVSSKDGVTYPVYLVSLTACPGDNNDTLFDEIKEHIANYKGRALLLFRHPCFKEINENTYAVIGTFYNGKAWSWTLLTGDDPEIQSMNITPENYDLETPVLDSSMQVTKEQGCPSHIVYQSVVDGRVDPETERLELPKESMTTTGIGGWKSYIF
jgi:hypothetical protein